MIGTFYLEGKAMKNGVIAAWLVGGLVLSLVAVKGCCIQVGCGPSAVRYERTVHHRRTVQLAGRMAAGPVFAAKSNDGWITVRGGEATDCSVTATIIARAESEASAERIAEETQVRLEQFGDRVTVKLDKPILVCNQRVDIQVEAMVPKSCDLELRTDDGDITVENVEGRIDVETDDGKVRLSQVGGVTRVRSDDGSIKAGEVRGDVKMRSDDGKIVVAYAEGAESVCSVSLVSDDGSIELLAPAGFSAEVAISTDDGSIDTDLPIEVTGKLGKRELRGSIGTGEGKLYIKTDDGSIRIR